MPPTIRTEILRVLTDKPGQVVYADEIMEKTGNTKSQVQKVMMNLLREELPGLSIAVAGNAWCYITGQQTVNVDTLLKGTFVPPRKKKVELRVFEEVGRTKSGEIMIRDQDMNLYTAKEM